MGYGKIAVMRMLLVRSLACAAALALALPALPEEQEPQGQQSQAEKSQTKAPTVKAEVDLVNLFATVRDKNKRVVTDLKQDDFKVFEDGHEEKIAFFAKEVQLPITLGLLLDTSVSEENMLPAIQDAGSRFLHRVMKKGDEALVISFDTDVDLLADFTDDRGILDRAIRKARINTAGGGYIAGNPGPVPITGGGTNLYDAIYLACSEKLNGEAGRKAIVVVTDAEDTGSKVKLEEAIESAQRTDTVIHVLFVADRWHYGGGRPDIGHKLAEETGGRMISVSSEKKIEEAFDQISEELRSQYTLGYYPSNTSRDGKFRKVRVETDHSDYKVLARRGYYAPRGSRG